MVARESRRTVHLLSKPCALSTWTFVPPKAGQAPAAQAQDDGRHLVLGVSFAPDFLHLGLGPINSWSRARSSVDRALASGARGRKFESCRARVVKSEPIGSAVVLAQPPVPVVCTQRPFRRPRSVPDVRGKTPERNQRRSP